MPDAIFDHPRLAEVYDPLDPDRSDLNTYVDLVDELSAKSILDVGCGTGALCVRLARLDLRASGADPAGASVAVARGKAGADRVRWVVGTALDVAADTSHHGQYDLVTMTANVAQVFLDDNEWLDTLRAVRTCLHPDGRIAFESRKPSDQGWKRWTRDQTRKVVDVPGEGPVETWVEVTHVDSGFVTFESPTIFRADGERIDSTSTLRFRTEEDLVRSLLEAGFTGTEVRDLPYAPTRGWLITAGA